MEHVFVETNWLVGCLAPAHRKVPAALDLLDRSRRGEIKLYLPAICLAECRRPILEKFLVRNEVDRVRAFLAWARSNNVIESNQVDSVRIVLEKMETLVRRDLDRFDEDLRGLCNEPGVEVFHILEEMWLRTTELFHLGLEPFDQAILGAILVKAGSLRTQGVNRFAFFEADSDLQPWKKNREPKRASKDALQRTRNQCVQRLFDSSNH